jgi:hypothetical protein
VLDEGALVVESLEDEVRDLLDDAGVGGAEELADLLESVDGGDLVVVGGDAVDHPRAPVGLHRPPALIHGCRSGPPPRSTADGGGWDLGGKGEMGVGGRRRRLGEGAWRICGSLRWVRSGPKAKAVSSSLPRETEPFCFLPHDTPTTRPVNVTKKILFKLMLTEFLSEFNFEPRQKIEIPQ